MATTLRLVKPRPSVRAVAAAAVTALCLGGVVVASMDTAHRTPALVPDTTVAPALPAAPFVPAPVIAPQPTIAPESTIAPQPTLAPQLTPAQAPSRARPEDTVPATGGSGSGTSQATPPQAVPQGGTSGPAVVDPADLYLGTDDGAPGTLPSKSTVKH